jgi:hypothetical protein
MELNHSSAHMSPLLLVLVLVMYLLNRYIGVMSLQVWPGMAQVTLLLSRSQLFPSQKYLGVWWNVWDPKGS